jgi:HSP20 family protein
MAETRTDTTRAREQKEGQQGLARQQEGRSVRRWDPEYGGGGSPFELMDRMSEEMDRWLDRVTGQFGFPRSFTSGRPRLGLQRQRGAWLPRIESGLKGDTFVVRADLPGLKKEDVDVEMTDDAITIRGERREEQQEEHEGYWRSEREYGQFQRTIPLPDGVIAESAKATFRDGVLEISMNAAPSEANRGRRLEIRDSAESAQKK